MITTSLLLAALAWFAPGDTLPPEAQRVLTDLRYIADDARQGRGLGTRGLEEAGAYIADQFQRLGLRPGAANGTWFQDFTVSPDAPAVAHLGLPATATRNVVAVLPGTSPALSGQVVIVGAHYDHLGLGGPNALDPDSTGAVHNGADDNGSGTVALIEIARRLAGTRPGRTIVFVAFSGEELGVLGSSRFVKSPPAACPPERMQLLVNLDMVGRPVKGKVFVEGAGSARDLRRSVEALPRREPPLPLILAFGGDGYGPSDQTPFLAKGVPVLHFFTGAHADYHRVSDTADKIDPPGLAAVARLAFRAAFDAAARPDRLEAVRSPAPGPPPGGGERGYGAYLGTIPDFAERAEPGVLVSAVRPGSPAEKGGLAAGDVVTGVGRVEVRTLSDLGVALKAHRPGEAVEVRFQRGGEARRIQATLGERQ